MGVLRTNGIDEELRTQSHAAELAGAKAVSPKVVEEVKRRGVEERSETLDRLERQAVNEKREG